MMTMNNCSSRPKSTTTKGLASCQQSAQRYRDTMMIAETDNTSTAVNLHRGITIKLSFKKGAEVNNMEVTTLSKSQKEYGRRRLAEIARTWGISEDKVIRILLGKEYGLFWNWKNADLFLNLEYNERYHKEK